MVVGNDQSGPSITSTGGNNNDTGPAGNKNANTGGSNPMSLLSGTVTLPVVGARPVWQVLAGAAALYYFVL